MIDKYMKSYTQLTNRYMKKHAPTIYKYMKSYTQLTTLYMK